MKALIVLCALIAYSQGKPGWAYSSIDLGSPAYVAAPIIAPAQAPVISAAAAAPVVAAAPAIVEAKTIVETAPVVTVAARTVVAPVAPTAVKTQYHAQDELGQASYGHAEPLQTHAAVQDAAGNKVGSFSYLNPSDGLIHRTDYIADALGYRVASNDLPVGPAGPVLDTPEVAIAKAAHLEAVSKIRSRRAVVVAAGHTPASTAPLVVAPAITTYTAPVAPIITPAAISYAAAPPAAIVAPALREATLTTIVNTPGHAVSYRVD